jgi:hypothetical protein
MSQERFITVRIDDRVRLLAAILSLTDWPQREQADKPHGVHAHARATQRFLADFADHPAVHSTQDLLNAGYALELLLGFAAYLNWPELDVPGARPEWAPHWWPSQIRDFYWASGLQVFWGKETPVWEQAIREAEHAFPASLDMLGLLEEFFGPRNVHLVFHPNLCYPTDRPIGFQRNNELVCVAPPPIAWGDNPPWPYDDDPAWACATAFGTYARTLLKAYLKAHPRETERARSGHLPVPEDFRKQHPDWFDQFALIFVDGVTAVFLGSTLGKAEADAFILMEHKAHVFAILPAAVGALQTYLADHKAGRYGEFADFLPTFHESLQAPGKPD